MQPPSDLEDILNDAVLLFGGQQIEDNETIQYGPLELTVAPKVRANTLLADHLFSPALLLSEQVERNLFKAPHKSVIELGAGCALPSLLLASSSDPPDLVVVTDYPDRGIISNLTNNVERNRNVFQPSCTVKCLGYEWGTDPSHLRNLLSSPKDGYDAMILSDLLHFDQSHDVLVSSITSLLARTPDARVHVAAGPYTRSEICDNFLRLAGSTGLHFDAVSCGSEWEGSLYVSGLDKEQLAVRKAACRYWIGRWLDVFPK
ncbi:hypothetical protein ONZ45_g6453 [Pleurotus djamor]|nr:hypothetical protein ONZ45_g6453 [Pleurotus djamor]